MEKKKPATLMAEALAKAVEKAAMKNFQSDLANELGKVFRKEEILKTDTRHGALRNG